MWSGMWMMFKRLLNNMQQRPIKFRAYDYVEKHFVYFELFKGVNNHTPPIYKHAKLSEWEQYTGLKDENGKEIYEGDIIYHKYYIKPELSVEQFEKEETFEVSIPDFFIRLGSDNITNSPESIEEFVSHFKVIGNRFENPELLKRVE